MIMLRVALALALTGGLLLALRISIASQVPTMGANTPNRLIVVFMPTATQEEHASAIGVLLDQFGEQGLLRLDPLGIDGPMPNTPAYLGFLAPDAKVPHLSTELASSPFVLRVEPDVPRHFVVITDSGPLDEEFQKGLQNYYFDIGVVTMWARGINGISPTNPITVAVIDTGVDLDHPDIDDNLVPGYDFTELDEEPQDESPDGHGSMVAGIIGAEINNEIMSGTACGVAGIGGGDALSGTFGLRVMALRVAVDSSVFSCALSAQAIDHARTHGARVINMSYGGEDACQLEVDAVQRAYDAEIILVASAGNNNSSTLFYPAAYGAGTNEHLVIAVAGVYPSGKKGDWSNYGEWVDVCAPYRQIRSLTNNGGYGSASGTSFSAPFVSGLIGLLMSNNGWPRDKVLSSILATADSVDSEYQGLLGAGRINADRASAMINEVYLPLVNKSN